jgi:CheY-like chemotaxis protein
MKGKRILLVDDDFNYRKILEALLKSSGFSVFLASNGMEALEYLQKQKFHLVVMDIQMPFMDGITALRKIFELEKDERPRIVAISAFFTESQKTELRNTGFTDLLLKPLNIRDLVKILNGDENGNHKFKDLPILNKGTIESLSKYGGSEDLYPIFENFIVETEQMLVELEKMDQQEYQKHGKSILHTLKGNSGSLGADKLSAKARDLEWKLKENQTTHWKEELKTLREYYQEFRQNYRTLIN